MTHPADNMLRSLRVLVVDDEFLIADYTSDILESAGHVVVGTAATADEALRRVTEAPVDLAIVDITLKGSTDGIALATRLREQGLPHIYISGSGDPATRARADATGPLAFLQKPFSEAQLLRILSQYRAGAGE